MLVCREVAACVLHNRVVLTGSWDTQMCSGTIIKLNICDLGCKALLSLRNL